VGAVVVVVGGGRAAAAGARMRALPLPALWPSPVFPVFIPARANATSKSTALIAVTARSYINAGDSSQGASVWVRCRGWACVFVDVCLSIALELLNQGHPWLSVT
jgi:hypothetical protein